MAMLARKVKDTVKNPQIILVTDRVDLDRQITTTLQKVEIEVINATSGKQLIQLLKGNGDFVTTSIINKFQAAVNELANNPLESPNIFVLIDEAHRTQYGVFNVNMERVLPNACFIVFTGTPLMKSQKVQPKNLVELLILIPSMKPLPTKQLFLFYTKADLRYKM